MKTFFLRPIPLLLLGCLPLFAAGDEQLQIVQPEQLANLLQLTGADKPLIFQVGFRVLYQQAHIPGSEYLGPAAKPAGKELLEKRVEKLPRNKMIVLYCGCCPWDRCPNVKPAYQELRAMGFIDVRILYLAKNFGVDWVDKGYLVIKGQ